MRFYHNVFVRLNYLTGLLVSLSLIGGGGALCQSKKTPLTPSSPPAKHASATEDAEAWFGSRIAELASEAKQTQENPKLTDKQKSDLLLQSEAEVGKIARRFPDVSKIQAAASIFSLQLGDSRTALTRANNAVTIAAKKNDSESLLMEARKTRALAHYRDGDYPKAYYDAFAVVRQLPRDKVAHTLVMLTKGRAKRAGKEVVPAEDLDQIQLILDQTSPLRDPRVRKILQDNARRLKAQRILASSARKLFLGDPNSTLLAAQRAFNLEPGNPDANMRLALAFLGLGMHKEAVDTAGNAIDLGARKGNDWLASAYGLRSMALLELSEYNKALADASQVLLFQPDNASAYFTRGKARYGLDGLTQQVLDDYKLAADHAPDLFADQYKDASMRYRALRAEKVAGAKNAAERSGKDSTALALKLGGLATGLILIGGFVTLRRREAAIKKEVVEIAKDAAGEIPGRYKLGPVIGEGGMGKVFAAEDSELGRKVAIKEFRPELQAIAKERDRFISEAKIVAGLKDVHVVEMYDIVHGKEKTCLVFEYVQGVTLDELILKSPGRKIELKKAIDIVNQACMGLTHAHTQNVIHRDLKPSNIMIEDSGNVKVMDFGVARQAKDALMNASAGTAVGTGCYAAPEQVYGKTSRVSDLYSLAVIFYEMLTGQRPFSGGTVQNDKLDGTFTLISQMGSFPPALDAFFKRALDPRPEKRYQNTREFMGGIDRAVEGA